MYLSASVSNEFLTGVPTGNAGRQYEVREEFQILLHKIAPWIHPGETDNKLYCSGYLQWDWRLGSVPFAAAKGGGNLTPMQCLLDTGTEHAMWVN